MSEPDVAPQDPSLATDDGFRFEISGGHIALDFANTISRRPSPDDDRDHLATFGRLVSWSVQAGLLTVDEGLRLRAEAGRQPRRAAEALRVAVTLREAIFAAFDARARGKRVPAESLDAVNAALPKALSHLRVAPKGGGFAWRFEHDATDLVPMLATVLRSVADLLISPDLARVRECDADTCSWLFLDRSKSGTRRWCDMKVCGNRAKARRHYQRAKKSGRRPRGPKRARR